MRAKKSSVEIFLLLIKDSLNYKDLILQLIKRDFGNQYRKTLLGVIWHLVTPIIGILSWMILNYGGLLKTGVTQVPYPVYVLVGSSIWGIFTSYYAAASHTLTSGQGFIHQVYYPHYTLLTKQMLQSSINFMISYSVVILTCIFLGTTPTAWVLLTPIFLIPIALWASTFGLLVSLLSVALNDISKIVSMGIGFLFYITPIVYSKDAAHPILQKLVSYNPIGHIVTLPRDLILNGTTTNFENYLISSCCSIILFTFSLKIFYVSELKVVEKLQ